MTELNLYASLSDDSVDEAKRTITGRIVPFGEVGQTSAGKTVINAGALSWSDNLRQVKLLVEHQAQDGAVGYATAIEARQDGLYATFQVVPGERGDTVLAMAQDGSRDGLSVGLDQVTYSPDSGDVAAVASARIREVSTVTVPAFAGAAVQTVNASHNKEIAVPDTDTQPDTVNGATELANLKAELAELKASFKATPPPNLNGPNGNDNKPKDLTLDRLTELAAAAKNDRSGSLVPELVAALSDVVPANAPMAFRPSYVTELVSGTAYKRRFIDNATTMKPLPATGTTITYPKWVTRPVVDDYAGNKGAVPSNAVEMTDATATVQRVAGAWDIDRIYWDRGDQAFISAFLEAQTESYQKKSNAIAVANALSGATALDADAGTGGVQAYADLQTAIVAGVVDFASRGEAVEYVAIAPNLFAEWLSITMMDAPAFFSGAFSLAGGGDGKFGDLPIFIEPGLTASSFVLGQKAAVRFHEAAPPVQVEVVNVANGGLDLGVFGYVAAYVWNPDLIRKGTVS